MKVGDVVTIVSSDCGALGIVISIEVMQGWSVSSASFGPVRMCRVLWSREIPTWYWGDGLVRDLAENLLQVVE